MTDDTEDPRLTALYRRAPGGEPDARSDRLIRTAARRAVATGASRARLAAWALAATVVLGAGVSWQLLTAPPKLDRGVPPGAEALTDERPSSPGRETLEARKARPAAPAEAAKAGPQGQAMPLPRGAGFLEDAASQADTATAGDADRAAADCSAYWLSGEAGTADWLAAIARARAAGEDRVAACLTARYRELFGARPAPDR